jgi:NAD+ synthase (glutamine-hydrolysing)
MKIALAQINTTVGALEDNTRLIIESLHAAKRQHADLVLFPELSITGYPPLDLLDRPRFIEKNLQCLAEIASHCVGISGIVGYVARNQNPQGKGLYNAAAVLSEGKHISTHYKSLLPTYDVFDEERYFEPAPEVHTVYLNGHRIGVSICEDIWNDSDFWTRQRYQKDPIEALAKQGMELLVNISASPFHVGKPAQRNAMVKALCLKHHCPAVYVNQVGGNDSLVFDGNSFALNAKGETLWQGKGFSTDFAVIDIETATNHDTSAPPTKERVKAITFPRKAEELTATDLEEIEEALVLGIRDYLKKTGFKSVVLGLSGGIDSALTAALAVKAIGPDKVFGVAMPSMYSSEGSVSDALALAKNLGIRCDVVPIAPIFESYTAGLQPLFSEREEDVTEENLQARIRGGLLMALSNKFGHLLLTTGNKSEMAVGYCTLYGDMCGGLAVIADLPKTWVYALSAYLNREHEVIPSATLTKPPSAELRPDQTDQDTLPDYTTLDAVLEAYIVDLLSPEEIIGQGFSAELVHWIIRKVNLNEYKRRQAPPGLKVTRKAFGQGRRYPIARGYD